MSNTHPLRWVCLATLLQLTLQLCSAAKFAAKDMSDEQDDHPCPDGYRYMGHAGGEPWCVESDREFRPLLERQDSLTEVTSAPRELIVAALEKAKFTKAADLRYVSAELTIMAVDSNKVFDKAFVKSFLPLQIQIQDAIVDVFDGKAKTVDAILQPGSGSLLISARIWPAGTSNIDNSTQAIQDAVLKGDESFAQALAMRLIASGEVESVTTGQLSVEVVDAKIPTVYRGAARCCCTADDASTCELMREGRIKLSWNPIRWGAPVCPKDKGFHHYARYPSLKDSVPKTCRGTTWDWIQTH